MELTTFYIMKYIFIGVSFTLKGQDFAKIAPILEKISKDIAGTGKTAILVNGFMPKHVVLEKGFDTVVVNTLEELFPIQINCYHKGRPDREEMSDILKETGGNAYLIGDLKEGVKEEWEIYTEKGVPTMQYTIE